MTSSGPRAPVLNRYFLGAVAVILLCSLGLGATVLSTFYWSYDRSASGVDKLVAFRAVLDAARLVSSERGPSNAALGRTLTGNVAKGGRLAAAREATDAAIAALPATPTRDALTHRLEAARGVIDDLLDRPRPERDPAAIERAVTGMFAAYDMTEPLIDGAMTALVTKGSNLMGRAVTARMLGEMRDDAGRLGSYLVIAIAQGHALTPEQSRAFSQTTGRVLELWRLVQQPIAVNGAGKLIQARQRVAEGFMRDGLGLIETTLAGLAERPPETTMAAFTRAIVPSFEPIEQLRDAYLDAALAELESQRKDAGKALAFATVTVLLALTLELLLMLTARRLFFHPLLVARAEVVRLASGRLEPEVTRPLLRGEMRGLFDSLDTLRGKLIEREKLDAERSRLAQQLKRQADTDGLTGVLNRGALERLVPRLAAGAGAVGLILLDLDHFKSVNDRHGHSAGDAVLRIAAQRLGAALRDGDVLARFGGEEFAILVTGQATATIAAIAGRLREAIDSEPFQLPDRTSISITASLGTAVTLPHARMWQDLLEEADAALYQAKRRGRNRVVAGGDGLWA